MTAKIRMSLASAPAQVVAESQPFILVPLPGVGVTASCDIFPNALVIEGTGYIFSGRAVITNPADDYWITPNQEHVRVHVPHALTAYQFELLAPSGSGSLQETIYPMTGRITSLLPPGIAGFDFGSFGRGCNVSTGTVQIHRLVVSNGQLSTLLATFEHSCESIPSNMVRGCIKLTR